MLQAGKERPDGGLERRDAIAVPGGKVDTDVHGRRPEPLHRGAERDVAGRLLVAPLVLDGHEDPHDREPLALDQDLPAERARRASVEVFGEAAREDRDLLAGGLLPGREEPSGPEPQSEEPGRVGGDAAHGHGDGGPVALQRERGLRGEHRAATHGMAPLIRATSAGPSRALFEMSIQRPSRNVPAGLASRTTSSAPDFSRTAIPCRFAASRSASVATTEPTPTTSPRSARAERRG